MKLKLFLFLFIACTLLAGRAMAQGCQTNPKIFPTGNSDTTLTPGFCIANVDAGSTGQGGRLRWDDSNNQELVLFDSDDTGNFLWCAGGAFGSGTGNQSLCRTGTILCLQHDGNMVLYAPNGPNTASVCVHDGDGGVAVWASNTDGDNDGQEVLEIEEDVVFNGSRRTGDRVVIRNGSGIKFVSLGYTD